MTILRNSKFLKKFELIFPKVIIVIINVHVFILRALKRAEIQLRSAQSSLEQQHRILEPLIIKLEEMQSKTKSRQSELYSLTNEVETLRKSLKQMVLIYITVQDDLLVIGGFMQYKVHHFVSI